MPATSGSDDAPATRRHAIRDGIDEAYDKASKAAHGAVELTKDGLDQARAGLTEAYASGLDKASEAFSSAREAARDAGKSAANGLDGNPLAAVLGGLALGVALGALLPRTERETEALGPIGSRLRGAAAEAAEAARGAGRDKLDELGLSRAHAGETVKSLLDGIIAAAGSAGAAALDSARKKPGA